jgi:integrase
MARPKKTDSPDLTQTHELSVGLIERLVCPEGVPKAFLRDKDVSGLRVRITSNGAKSFVYEAWLNGKSISKTLGGFPLMSIEEAKDQARELAKTIKNDKLDPRELDREKAAQKATAVAAAIALEEASKVLAVTVREVWTIYIAERKLHWGERHYADHIKQAAPGGIPSMRRGFKDQLTKSGPLASLMVLPLNTLTAPVIEAWSAKEAITRATSARLAWRMLKVFLGWCEEQPAYAGILQAKNPAKTKKSRESLGKPRVKSGVLQRGQLKVWFTAVQQAHNPIIAACLQMMLLTGARPGEVLTLEWEDLNTRWKGIQIRDKVEGTREIPATPYMLHLLATLPRRNKWIFSSPSSESGHIQVPNIAHTRACEVAGLAGLTLHDLRRSFKSLTEWIEIPAGVVAQLMGHKPSATAEKHYTVRPLELLALHHNKIEAWILEQAGIEFDAKAAPGSLRAVG